MSTTGEPVSRFERARIALERFAPLAWLKCSSETDNAGLVQMPLLGWRFSEPHPELQGMFSSVVQDAPRRVTWTFKEGRNALIAPSRLALREQSGEDPLGVAIDITSSDQQLCIAASEDIERIIQAIAAQPALPIATRLYVQQLAKCSVGELVCVVKNFTGEARAGMVFRPVGAADVELRLTSIRWYPPRPETMSRAPLAKVTLVGHGAERVGLKELLVSVPDQ
ncbi:hypothetical protein [Streptomyces globosus]|uniref:hypothetical protein n=1 Tax=Streptomyces globosus TaxID=68209 RepID=UPI0031E176EA